VPEFEAFSPKGVHLIRSVARTLVLLPLVACGVFGGSGGEDTPVAPGTDPARTPEQEKQKAEDNAKPIDATGAAPLEGVFVSSAALDDAGDGTRDKPFKSIAKGLAKGKQLGLRVLVCAVKGAPYTEQVTLLDGVSVFGDVVCADGKWAVDKTVRAEIASPVSPALVAEGLKLKLRVEGFDVSAPDLGIEAPSPNSIALLGRDVTDLSFALGSLRAGSGRPGKSAGAAPNQTVVGDIGGTKGLNRRACGGIGDVCDPGLGGKYGQTQDGGNGGVGSCKIGEAGRAGAKGGYGGFWVEGYKRTDLFQPPLGLANLSDTGQATEVPGGALASFTGPASGAAGQTGVEGARGEDGSNADATLAAAGRFDREGYVPSNGVAGKAGGPGGGGSGGAGSTSMLISVGGNCASSAAMTGKHFYASGGGGGAGGCGGQPSEVGAGGGASTGALLINATVSFETARVQAGAGGAAGRGGFGSTPTTGGLGAPPGDSNTCSNAGRGGDGGAGGVPGFSGHGAAGPSIGIAYSGKVPSQVDTTITVGTPGSPQDAASFTFPNGTTQSIPKGQAGEARELFSFSL